MIAGVLHGALFQMASAFAEPFALLPVFLAQFTASKVLIGLSISLIQAASIVPQIPVSRLMRRRHDLGKPLMLAGIWTRCGVWGLLALLTVTITGSGPVLLAVFIILLTIYSMGGGVAGLPLNQIIGETIPPEKRSSFFGWRLFWGGVLAMLSGYVVKRVLGSTSLEWPRNYGILFFLCFVTLIMAYVAMSLLKPAPSPPGKTPTKSGPVFAELREALSAYPVLKRLIAIRIFAGGLVLAMPFLTLYGKENLHFPLKWIGVFIIAQKMGTILSTFLWMPVGNKIGTKILIVVGLVGVCAGLLPIGFVKTPAVFVALLFVIGAGATGMQVGFNGYILELGSTEVLPLLVAIQGTLLFPVYFMPLAGGALVDAAGYNILFLVAFILVLLALVLSLGLCEPRSGKPECGIVQAST